MKKIITIIALLSSSLYAGKMIQIKGSDTMVNMVQILSEKYMAQNKGQMVSVTGGGSGTGIAAILNNTCDIANASRDIKKQEKEKAKNGISGFIIGIDGLSVIVHKDNGINELTISQLGKIFRGEVTNWKELGGADVKISMYGRQPNSGTFDFFREHIVKADYAKTVKEMNGNAQIVEAVKNSNNASGIGYVGAGYVQDAKDLKILKIASANGQPSYLPTKENVAKKLYPISRALNQYVSVNLATADVKNFIKFEISDAGQQIIMDEGFFPITKEQKEANELALK